MNKIDNKTKEIRELLAPIVEGLVIKTYFSYYGLFKDNLMFGLYKDNKLYLKISKEFIRDEHYSTFFNENSVLMCDFYFVAENQWDKFFKDADWLLSLIQSLKTEREKVTAKRLIRHLPNMNINLERLLQRNGIKTVGELHHLGEVDVFVKLIEKGFDVTEPLLFKLHGALNNQLVYTLNNKQKEYLLEEADTALYNAGLRKRFTKK
ncbi:TfoX/Sxy family DNA transformation protein [Pasteurella atlantica]|nr:TfoX/Sxy family DNA transformation protein [Pasteurella atlantica]MBR0573598.1 TfoX/Sxy family DNA transformation protein [Pasteurella atlantica]MDP8033047.1 TfoX/Sxy family DNA transformation protein [Pasteurella atlantica]MDP8034984.1 TfoX/Sxy family DNA transformation protein [Pasteurella atlantica]MDP8037056.1 TfoX/Sxy family DNA transformation protein [Pasteurella atlantica]MDP8039540.1 TfoX/Sxy family DNA transformation protein [Pasteurella atlantica]